MRWTAGAVTVQTGVSGTIMTSTTSGLSWCGEGGSGENKQQHSRFTPRRRCPVNRNAPCHLTLPPSCRLLRFSLFLPFLRRVTKAGPVLMGAVSVPGYALFSVTVLSEDEAVAVGGSPLVPEGTGSAGVIVRTVNGGLSWSISQYPGAGTARVPALMGVAAQPKTDAVWAGGYVTAANTVATLATGAEFCAGPRPAPPVLAPPGLLRSLCACAFRNHTGGHAL